MSGDESSFGEGRDPLREMRDRIHRGREAFFEEPQWPTPDDRFFRDPSIYDFGASPGFRSHFNMSPFSTERDIGNSNDGSVPIRVFHERPKYQGTRKTTEIPSAASASNGPESPRLLRARSEPPKAADNKSNRNNSHLAAFCSTIPENAEAGSLGRSNLSSSPATLQSSSNNHKLSGSASSPSVPAASDRVRALHQGHSIPAPPPPPPPPADPQWRQSRPVEQTAAPKVRQIPIFVEGRSEPVTPKKSCSIDVDESAAEIQPSSPFRQPSDFYPPDVQRVRTTQSPGTGRKGLRLPPEPATTTCHREPTSPLSPPPSDQPIPMGYVASASAAPAEATTPLPRPPGPIPMPCGRQWTKKDSVDTPDGAMAQQPSASDGSASEPQAASIASPDADNETPAEKRGKLSAAEEKLHKIESEVGELLKRIESFRGNKKDKEYLYLDDSLTQKMCQLDGIEAEGRDDIRQRRRESIKTINRCLSLLDRRACIPAQKESAEPTPSEVCDAVLSELIAEDDQK